MYDQSSLPNQPASIHRQRVSERREASLPRASAATAAGRPINQTNDGSE
jgi:hypothetical protein